MMFSTALVLIKSLLLWRPMSGLSVLAGIGGLLCSSSSSYLNGFSEKEKI